MNHETTIKRIQELVECISKPITIAVVLRALREIQQKQKLWFGYELVQTQSSVLEKWNLSKDNFNDQSEETKSFIGELLN